MKEYISGYYCRDDLHLQVINKESNRRILQALKDAYPNGLTVFELAEVTDLPLKTIYAQKAELYREYYINHIDEKKIKTRGRPTIHTKEVESQRNRTRIVIEEAMEFMIFTMAKSQSLFHQETLYILKDLWMLGIR